MSRHQRFTRLALLSAVTMAFTVALYAASWHSSWNVAAADARVRNVELDVERYGTVPSTYWLATDRLLVVVPEALTSLEAGAAGTARVLVVDPETTEDSWRTLDGLLFDDAVSVQWGLERHVSRQNSDAYLSVRPGGEGPVAQLSFFGLRFPLPVYNLNLPAFSEPGWRVETRYLGLLRLMVRRSRSEPASIELTQLLVNSAVFPDLYSLATWLPGGRFLLLSPMPYGERRLLLVGPVPPFPNVEPDQA